ncbi:3-hydroxyacyl-CoA dehydrogenase [Aeromicrobium sp. Root472D3]|uniref:3-hydroxyacyl-CoA dehydrogenase n=1 Tax=Aeromicrobium sp. Root472D3 TaxID=1736540 RepID=UPI0009EAF89A|nr:3-hydroxyacyl-CoA dehydrogenase [Aeromicrobium sp. Root472D3]
MSLVNEDTSAGDRSAGRGAADPVAVVGAGSIGVAWAVVFACAGRSVRLFDLDPRRLDASVEEVADTIEQMALVGLVAGDVSTVIGRVRACASLEEAVAGVSYVQECILEEVGAKRSLFAALDAATSPGTVLASSTSTIMASRFADGLPGRDRCLVVHPGNPPYFLRVAEIVPAPFTSSETVANAVSMVESLEMAPVVLTREIEGFVFNRLQGALLREAYCLVRDGVVSPVDVDTIVREGLGRRWAVMGPFATNELNTRGGLRQHAELHGRVYARLGIERSTEDPWTPDTVDRVAREIEQSLPHDDWADNVRERDRTMIAIAALMRGFDNPLNGVAPAPAVAAATAPAAT